MGYENTLKIKGEIDERFKSNRTFIDRNNLESYKALLFGTCLCHYDSTDSVARKNIYSEIATLTRMYFWEIEEIWKYDLKKTLEECNNEFYVHGWEFAHDDYYDFNKEDYLHKVISDLFIYTICANVSMLDDKEKWEEKFSIISGIVENIYDTIFEILDHDFYDTYRNKEETEQEESY